ncbi:hypothetical protein [Rhizobium binae]|uniref:hypothetical protein n=2 Tax=Rhizobium binae TaxID=1138190 RepID=UPI001C82B1D7|nr:hypothetical protein [Rhizobium binae]MBX4983135.1 hypothetical protein [Rhizobium binae]
MLSAFSFANGIIKVAASKGNNMLSVERYFYADGVVGGTIILSLVFLFLAIEEAREILFYIRNNWNFDIDSNIGGKIYKGDSTGDRDLVTNRSRVLYGRPFLIVVFLAFLIIHIAVLFSK